MFSDHHERECCCRSSSDQEPRSSSWPLSPFVCFCSQCFFIVIVVFNMPYHLALGMLLWIWMLNNVEHQFKDRLHKFCVGQKSWWFFRQETFFEGGWSCITLEELVAVVIFSCFTLVVLEDSVEATGLSFLDWKHFASPRRNQNISQIDRPGLNLAWGFKHYNDLVMSSMMLGSSIFLVVILSECLW